MTIQPTEFSIVRETLERGMSGHLGKEVRITSLEAKPVDTFSTNPITRLHATLDSGESMSIIFKQLIEKPNKNPAGEVLLYRSLLPDGRFGAPILYASLCDEARYWLFLEDVGEWRLEWCEPDDWKGAFRQMARMHAAYHGREDELRGFGFLPEHGPRFYRSLAEDARRSLEERAEKNALPRFDGIMGGFGAVVSFMEGQPKTFVHGDLSCHNIMVGEGMEVRFVDWEWAAIGNAAWDLSKLLAGWKKEKPLFTDAYTEEFERCAGVPLDIGRFRLALECCEVFKVLWYMKWWTRQCEEPEQVRRLLGKMEKSMERVGG